MLEVYCHCGRPSLDSTVDKFEGDILVSSNPKSSKLLFSVHSWTAFCVWRLFSPQIFQLPILNITGGKDLHPLEAPCLLTLLATFFLSDCFWGRVGSFIITLTKGNGCSFSSGCLHCIGRFTVAL